ncbi:hypothetical protein DH2020_010022 [Rehmannia glutinosa]|uniref:Response regulatory domain-containing protein n=1 Tax=Rehmannia glutinosa TaxID=99300 RepID=A0ABR0X9W7_REHGL
MVSSAQSIPVVTVKHANDALCALRIKGGGAFDLVVSDVHMPDMNGFELQQAIAQEFNNLPVVCKMSADDKESVALKGLENGAAFFIYKPVCPDDVRDLWQFAAMKKKSQVVIEDTTTSEDKTSMSASSVNEDKMNKKDSRENPLKRRDLMKKKENLLNLLRKKSPKLFGLIRYTTDSWKLLGALALIKYRIFLRRVSDASYKIQYSADHYKGLSRNFMRSSIESSGITSPSSTLVLNKFNKFPYQKHGQFPANVDFAPLANPEASSSNLITQSGFGQSRLISNKANLLKPNIGNANLMIHQNDRPCVRLAQNSFQTRPSLIQGHISNISLEDLSTALSASFDSSLISPIVNPSTNNYDVSSSFTNIATTSNYVGFSISNIKHLAESGHSSSGLDSCKGATINLPSHEELQSNSIVVPNANIANVDELAPNVGANSNYLLFDDNINGIGDEQLSDVIGDYRVLMPSNYLPLNCGEEINGGGLIHDQSADFSPMFDFSELDLLSTQQQLEEGDFDTTILADHVNIQNQTQRDDDDFLESLLAPFDEDQTLEGI